MSATCARCGGQLDADAGDLVSGHCPECWVAVLADRDRQEFELDARARAGESLTEDEQRTWAEILDRAYEERGMQ